MAQSRVFFQLLRAIPRSFFFTQEPVFPLEVQQLWQSPQGNPGADWPKIFCELTRTRGGTNATNCGKDLTWPSRIPTRCCKDFFSNFRTGSGKLPDQVQYHSGPEAVLDTFNDFQQFQKNCQSLTVLVKCDKFLCWFEFRILHCFGWWLFKVRPFVEIGFTIKISTP